MAKFHVADFKFFLSSIVSNKTSFFVFIFTNIVKIFGKVCEKISVSTFLPFPNTTHIVRKMYNLSKQQFYNVMKMQYSNIKLKSLPVFHILDAATGIVKNKKTNITISILKKRRVKKL